MSFKDKQNLPTIFSSDPSAIAAAAAVKARIESAYMMALHKPRNFDQSRTKILEACKRPEFAKEVEFDRIQGKKFNPKTRQWEDNHIYGLSIRFTEVALSSWTNVLTESQMIYEDESVRRVRIAVLDLEENVCFSHDVQFTKTVERKSKKGRVVVSERLNTEGKTVYVVRATPEELQNKENALVSKTLRNEGLRLIPEDIKTEAIKLARETVLNEDARDPAAAKKNVLDGFAGLGIWPKDVEKYLKHSLDVITPIELQQLRAIYKAVKDGEATWHSFIEESEPEEPPEDLTDKIKNGKEGTAENLYGGKGAQGTDGKPPGPDDTFIAEFHGLRKGDEVKTGLLVYWQDNQDRLRAASDKVKAAWEKRYEKVYEEPWSQERWEPVAQPPSGADLVKAVGGDTEGDPAGENDLPKDSQREVLRGLMATLELSDKEMGDFYAFTMGNKPTKARAQEFIEGFDEKFQEYTDSQPQTTATGEELK